MSGLLDTHDVATPAAEQHSAVNWRQVAYFIGVPLVVSVYAGLNNWQMQATAGLPATILFYVAHSMLPWWITCTATFVAMKSLSRWKPPWALLLLLGHSIGCLVVLPYSNWLTTAYEMRWPELEIGPEFGPLLSPEFWGYFLRAGVMWFGINFVFDRFFGLPLYRYNIPRGYDTGRKPTGLDTNGPPLPLGVPQPQDIKDDRSQTAPIFLDRLPARLQSNEILAIKAEQHYIRVYTLTREYMVLYRFSDAVHELDKTLGTQVHRSYWVNTRMVESVHTRAKNFHLRLTNGVTIPVSIPYQGMVRELARNLHWPVRG